jgi:hypothetical protein
VATCGPPMASTRVGDETGGEGGRIGEYLNFKRADWGLASDGWWGAERMIVMDVLDGCGSGLHVETAFLSVVGTQQGFACDPTVHRLYKNHTTSSHVVPSFPQ